VLTIVALGLGFIFTAFWTTVGVQETRATSSGVDLCMTLGCSAVALVQALALLANLCAAW
jgi:hypothetical protein